MKEGLPRGWAWATVGDTGRYINGLAFKPEDWKTDGRPIIRIQNLTNPVASFNRTDRVVAEDVLVSRGDILVSWSATLDAFRWSGPEAVLNQHIFRVVPANAVDASFLFHGLRLVIREMADGEHTHGSTMKHINRGPFLAHRFPLPPRNEQERIVAKVDALQSRSRRAREALDAVPPLLEKLRQSILAAAFRGDLTKDWREKNKDVEPAEKLLARIRTERRKKWEEAELAKLTAKGKAPTDDRWKAKYKEPEPVDTKGLPALPDGWCWAAASDVVAPETVITYGIVLPGPPLEDGVPYVRGQDIEDGRILVDQLWRTTPAIAAAHARSELAEGDVLLCIIRHLKVAIVPGGLDGANLTQGTVRLRPSHGILATYLARYLESPAAQIWMKARYFGNAMPRINVEDAREIPVPFAPLAEQRAIDVAIGNRLAAVETARRASTSCSDRQTSLDRAILAKAFRGELVPQDPADEPADVMLARLRAEAPDPAAPVSAKRAKPGRRKAG